MRFSVIIPTYNSASTLAGTLQDLALQTVAPAEIIVADGRSQDATAEIARQYGARVVDNPVRHAAGGRNRGAQVASGDWLAFTDSDCRLEATWLSRAASLITENDDLVGLAGPMRATPPRNEIERVAGNAFLEGVMQFPSQAVRATNRDLRGAFITANVFYRHDIFDAVGGFDEWFATEAEDIDFFWRTLARYPGRLLYDPTLPVYHCFPTTWGGLFRKWHSYGIASCRLQKRHLGVLRVDGSHYRRLADAAWDLIAARGQRTENLARVVQLTGHLLGKYHGSLRFGIVNL